jgi:hypothetical protein
MLLNIRQTMANARFILSGRGAEDVRKDVDLGKWRQREYLQ